MKRIVTLLIVAILILGFFGQTFAINLYAQGERPYTDDNNDGEVGNDVYRFLKRNRRIKQRIHNV